MFINCMQGIYTIKQMKSLDTTDIISHSSLADELG